MRRMILILVCLTGILEAKVKVVTAYLYIADLVEQIGGEYVEVTPLAKATRDPHFIVPKPSFIAKVRNADILVINGGELEVGWIPPLVAQSGNPQIQPGAKGYLELARHVVMTGRPEELSRAHGDVHALGNPHFAVDMHQIPRMSRAIAEALCGVDSANCTRYETNTLEFVKAWGSKVAAWEKRLHVLKGKKVVQAHALFDYLLNDVGMETVITLEPVPGIPPTAKHLAKVIQTIKNEKITMLITSVYFPRRAVETVREKTGIRIVELPHDVGAVTGASSIEAMFDTIVEALTR